MTRRSKNKNKSTLLGSSPLNALICYNWGKMTLMLVLLLLHFKPCCPPGTCGRAINKTSYVEGGLTDRFYFCFIYLGFVSVRFRLFLFHFIFVSIFVLFRSRLFHWFGRFSVPFRSVSIPFALQIRVRSISVPVSICFSPSSHSAFIQVSGSVHNPYIPLKL